MSWHLINNPPAEGFIIEEGSTRVIPEDDRPSSSQSSGLESPSPAPRSLPLRVQGLTTVTSISGGYYHSLAVKANGTLWAWGSNSHGELGDGTRDTRTTAVRVSTLTNVVSAVACGEYSLALRSDGTVWSWGQNNNGQLGESTDAVASRTEPRRIVGLSDITMLAAGAYSALALRSDGTVWAWGNGHLVPTQVPGVSGVTAIASGSFHGLAQRSDGTVWAWGDNYRGQLGGEGPDSPSVPVLVPGESGIRLVSASDESSLVLRADRTVAGWGYNADGQLGNGLPQFVEKPSRTLLR